MFVVKGQGRTLPHEWRLAKPHNHQEGYVERQLMPDLILLLICVRVDLPVSIPGKKRNRTGRFRGEISPEEPTVTVTSLEEEPGQPRVLQEVTTGSCQHFHGLLPCVPLHCPLRAGLYRRDSFGSPRKFWAMCSPHFPLRRDFTMLLQDATC